MRFAHILIEFYQTCSLPDSAQLFCRRLAWVPAAIMFEWWRECCVSIAQALMARVLPAFCASFVQVLMARVYGCQTPNHRVNSN
jgi:hypothetical protein